MFRRVGHRVSTFLHPFAPPALPGFLATMGALTPARRRDASARGAPLPEGSTSASFLLLRRAGLLASRIPSLWSLPSPTTSLPPITAFPPILSVMGFPLARAWASPFDRRLASQHGRIEFAFATDDSIASRCSPPHLAVTQLRSVTSLIGSAEEDLHLLGQIALASARFARSSRAMTVKRQ